MTIKDTSYADDFYGWCGTTEEMSRQNCFKCITDREHPFHDDGSPNSIDSHLWEKGGEYDAPTH